MEELLFNEIRTEFCLKNPKIEKGKMMRSEAITYNGKVFAFFSLKRKMVFKLGNNIDTNSLGIEINVFNPFKKRAPLNGWFEVPFTEKENWRPLTQKALETIKKQK